MDHDIPRRDFLKAAPAAASVLAFGMQPPPPPAPAPAPAYPKIGAATYVPGADYPIRATPFTAVTLDDAFWRPKRETNARVTIPFEANRSGMARGGLSGNVLEAAIHSLQTHPDPTLQAQVDARVEALAGATPQRVPRNDGFEVAAAWHAATGRRTLLDPAIRDAAALYARFATEQPPFSGGERDAINCLQLYRATHDRTHLDLAKHYLDIRGLPSSQNRSRHNQSYRPVLEQSEAVGHAVNGVTLMLSLLDVGMLTGIRPYVDAAQRMWQDATSRKMYVTGGVGSTGNEGFGEPYVLPTISAYAETCAVLMFMTLNHRLFLATGDARYVDVLERGMYNNALSGVATTGDHFFYVNRLASAGDGRDVRWQRASLECCPPNLVRFMATMPGYVYAQGPGDALYVNLYASSHARFTVGGRPLTLAVESEMPWGGRSTLTISAPAPTHAALKLRIPGWARNTPAPGALYAYADRAPAEPTLTVNGTRASAVPDRAGYVTLDRTWKDGDTIALAFPMPVRRVVADARVHETRGRVAFERGPIVFCAEAPDVEGGDVFDLRVSPDATPTPTVATDLGGVTALYTTATSLTRPSAPARRVRLIPYHLWANRGAQRMSVWLPTRDYAVGDVGPAGGRIFYVHPEPATAGWRYLEAAPYDQSLGAKWGCFRHAITGARGTAVGTGRQNTADIVAACDDPTTAAALCARLRVNGVADWFLPSRDELALLYANLQATGTSDFGVRGASDNVSYWTSTQETTDMAHHVDFADLGRQHYDDKDYPRRVRAIRAF